MDSEGGQPSKATAMTPLPMVSRLGCHSQIGISTTPFYHVLMYQRGMKSTHLYGLGFEH